MSFPCITFGYAVALAILFAVIGMLTGLGFLAHTANIFLLAWWLSSMFRHCDKYFPDSYNSSPR